MIIQPLRISNRGSLYGTTSEAENISSQIKQVLFTRASGEGLIGELPWDTDFGSGVEYLRHLKTRSQEVAEDLARHYCVEALQKYVPDMEILAVNTTQEQIEGRGTALNIEIVWQKAITRGTTILTV